MVLPSKSINTWSTLTECTFCDLSSCRFRPECGTNTGGVCSNGGFISSILASPARILSRTMPSQCRLQFCTLVAVFCFTLLPIGIFLPRGSMFSLHVRSRDLRAMPDHFSLLQEGIDINKPKMTSVMTESASNAPLLGKHCLPIMQGFPHS